MKTRSLRLRRRGDRFFLPRGGPLGFAEFAGRLARGWLWLDGWFTSPSRGPQRISVELDGKAHEVDAERFSFSREDLSELAAAGQILVLPLDAGDSPSIDAVHLQLDGCWYTWTGSRRMPIRPDLAFRLPEKIEAFSPEIELVFRQFWLDVCAPAASEAEADPVFALNAAAVERLIPPPVEEEEVEEEEEIEEEEVEEEEVEDVEEVEEEEVEEVEEEPPAFVAESDQPLGLSLEQVVVIDDHHVFLRGWWWDAEDVVEGMDLISPAGARETEETEEQELETPEAEEQEPEAPADGEDREVQEPEEQPSVAREPVLGSLIQTPRPDVADLFRESYGDRADGACGFFGLVRLSEPAEGHRGYRLELRPTVGDPVQVGRRPPIVEPFAGREVVLSSLPKDQAPNLDLLRDHVAPALEPLQARCRELGAIAHRFEFSQPPASPGISLLVPLFRRLDLVEHQLAHLAGDPALPDCELIYVLDSPELAPQLEPDLFHLSRLFEVPVRGLVLERSVGFAGAINAAAAVARGRRLVLLHSDVFPDRPGWLRAMAELADSNDRIGIVGPKLLYEDRALQHAGINFSRDRRADGLWSAVPFFKGLPERFSRAGVTRRVPAVSGACLMIDRALFEDAGGLRDAYVAGDLEDADLCLRCLEAGYESWYLASAALYHLEGLSQLPGLGWQRNPWTDLYNRYLFDQRWDEQVREVTDLLA